MPEAASDVIVHALKAIAIGAGYSVLTDAPAWHRDSDADCAVFSYQRDFALLWGVSGDGLSKIAEALKRRSKEYTFVVVWDGVPEAETIAVSRYVTAYDWAMALSLALYGNDDSSGPKLRILILNLPSLSRDGFVQRNLFAFHNVLPWIQGYEVCKLGTDWLAEAVLDANDPDAYSLLRQAQPPHRQDAPLLVADLANLRRVTTTFHDYDNPADRKKCLETVCEAWRQEFLKPGDRHAVANLIGPFILTSGLSDGIRQQCMSLIEAGSLARQALRRILEQLGLLEIKRSKSSSFGQTGLVSDGGIFGRRKDVRILLVDDQFAMGYQHVLATVLLGANYHPAEAHTEQGRWHYAASDLARIRCVSSADYLLATLERLNPVEDWALPRKISIPECDVLLLDLRLWNDNPEARKAFMERLVRLCNSIGAKYLADPQFQVAWRAAQRIANGEEGGEIQALPLLALLISHYDPSLPIILFSSTHQRDVVTAVANRPNIIASFAKPLLAGYGEKQQPIMMIRNLADAMRQAIDLHEAGIVWERILRTAWTRKNPIVTMVYDKVKKQYNHHTEPNLIHAPAVSGQELKRVLGEHFRHYLAGKHYFDFAALPFEFIEGAMTPDADVLARDGVPENASFQLSFGLRNQFASGLKKIRNQKAHGHAPTPSGTSDQEDWRLATIVGFLALLDYIEEKRCMIDERLTKRMIADAMADGSWLAFVARAIGNGILDSRRTTDNMQYGSDALLIAVARLLAQPAPVGAVTGDAIEFETCTVVSHAEGGFWVGSGETVFGYCECSKDAKPPIGGVIAVEFDYTRITADGYFFVKAASC